MFAGAALAQGTVVVNDPNAPAAGARATAAEKALIEREVLPKARKYWADNDSCREEFGIAGDATGAFTKPKANQRLVFYQFCQTGNGFGNNGLVLFEGGRIVASYVSESGWALELRVLPDVDRNGLDEFLLYYSGGLHQGQGGTGVDVMEFSGSAVKGLGWFQAESFGEDGGDWTLKVTAKPGKTPVFYRQKYVSAPKNKWRPSGKSAVLKLGEAVSAFEELK